MRTIAVFVLVGMLGTYVLEQLGIAHFGVPPTAIVSVLLGGALLGIGFGLTGYCPGTGLAGAAAGRLDALAAVVGMMFGALVYAGIWPAIGKPLDTIANYGCIMLPDLTGIPRVVWVTAMVVGGTLVLAFTAPRRSDSGPTEPQS